MTHSATSTNARRRKNESQAPYFLPSPQVSGEA
jgi:hypothetical protein